MLAIYVNKGIVEERNIFIRILEEHAITSREGDMWTSDQAMELTDVSVGKSQIWGIGLGQKIYQKLEGSTEWKEIGGRLVQVSFPEFLLVIVIAFKV